MENEWREIETEIPIRKRSCSCLLKMNIHTNADRTKFVHSRYCSINLWAMAASLRYFILIITIFFVFGFVWAIALAYERFVTSLNLPLMYYNKKNRNTNANKSCIGSKTSNTISYYMMNKTLQNRKNKKTNEEKIKIVYTKWRTNEPNMIFFFESIRNAKYNSKILNEKQKWTNVNKIYLALFRSLLFGFICWCWFVVSL